MRAVMVAGVLTLALALPARAQAPAGQVTARTTAYCLNGMTRSEEWTRPGVVAVDRSLIPLWSHVSIEGFDQEFTALDTGSGVIGAHVDIWMVSCQDAINWGSQTREVSWWP